MSFLGPLALVLLLLHIVAVVVSGKNKDIGKEGNKTVSVSDTKCKILKHVCGWTIVTELLQNYQSDAFIHTPITEANLI